MSRDQAASDHEADGLVALVGRRFHAFAAGYLGAGGDDFAYELKIRHTDEVLRLATEICRQESLPERVALAARLAAILHDVGRFPQYRQFRSFRDRDTANHAALSIRHLLREKMLAGVPRDIRKLVLGAVFLHNVRLVPADLPADLLATVRVLRDADKLDILRVMVVHFAQPDPAHPEVALDARPSPDQYSAQVYDAVLRREVSDYRHIIWHNDFKLMCLGWMYDLNHRASLRLLRDMGQFHRVFSLLPDTEPMRILRAQIDSDLAKSIEGA